MGKGKYQPNKIDPEVATAFRSTLLDLVVDAERAAWILETYPPGDMGRPGILVVRKPDDVRNKRSGVENAEDELSEDGGRELVAAD